MQWLASHAKRDSIVHNKGKRNLPSYKGHLRKSTHGQELSQGLPKTRQDMEPHLRRYFVFHLQACRVLYVMRPEMRPTAAAGSICPPSVLSAGLPQRCRSCGHCCASSLLPLFQMEEWSQPITCTLFHFRDGQPDRARCFDWQRPSSRAAPEAMLTYNWRCLNDQPHADPRWLQDRPADDRPWRRHQPKQLMNLQTMQ